MTSILHAPVSQEIIDLTAEMGAVLRFWDNELIGQCPVIGIHGVWTPLRPVQVTRVSLVDAQGERSVWVGLLNLSAGFVVIMHNGHAFAGCEFQP